MHAGLVLIALQRIVFLRAFNRRVRGDFAEFAEKILVEQVCNLAAIAIGQ